MFKNVYKNSGINIFLGLNVLIHGIIFKSLIRAAGGRESLTAGS